MLAPTLLLSSIYLFLFSPTKTGRVWVAGRQTHPSSHAHPPLSLMSLIATMCHLLRLVSYLLQAHHAQWQHGYHSLLG